MPRNRELMEWLGLTRADFLTYAACACAGAMYLVRDTSIDFVLAVTAFSLALIACSFGMRRDPEVSKLANVAKFVCYPICVLIVMGLIAANYYVWK